MKVRKFLLPILILLLFGTYVSAHPGSTDGDGGHFDHSSGEYHYHHGYPAHEHSDGECPYDFDDQENSSASFSSKKTATANTATPSEQKPSKPSTVKKSKVGKVLEIIMLVILGPVVYFVFSMAIAFAVAFFHWLVACILLLPKKLYDLFFKK
jgi:hypothetical protein